MKAAESNPPPRVRRRTTTASGAAAQPARRGADAGRGWWAHGRVAALFERLRTGRRGTIPVGQASPEAAAAIAAAVGVGVVRSASLEPALASLRRLLDQHPPARRVLRHLALVELALSASLDIERLSPRLLGSALGQLERLTAGRPDQALAPLKARLAGALRGVPVLQVAQAWEPPDVMSRFAESRLMVADATLSTFESVEAMFEPRRAR